MQIEALCGVAALTLALLLAPASARADDACIAGYEGAQLARKAGHLIEARRDALACSRPACPGAMTSECGEWLREIDAALPSVVLAFERPDGGDAIGAQVTLDGAATDLAGRAIPLDPGTHVVRITLDGFEPLERRFLLQEGEQRRRITGKLVARAEASSSSSSSSSSSASPSRWPALAFLGLSVASYGAAIGFGTAASADFNALSDRCAPSCAHADAARVRRKAIAADVGLGLGTVSLAAAAFFFFRVAPSSGVTVAASAGVAPGAAALRFEGTF